MSSSNEELLKTLEYDVHAAASVLLSDASTDIISAVPLNRIFRLTGDAAHVEFSYLAHITFVHVSKVPMLGAAAKASTNNPLQRAMGDGARACPTGRGLG